MNTEDPMSQPPATGPVSSEPAPLREDAQVAVVTGGARGLGAAVARRLSDAGWRLVLLDAPTDPALAASAASAADLTALAAGLHDAVAVPGDVRAQDDVDRAVTTALDRYGRLDAAIAVAGVIAGGAPAWRIPDEHWQLLMDVNVTGVLHLIRAAIPPLLEAPSGRFVAVSSAAGTRPLPRLAGYSASKHATVGLVRSLAADLAGTRVTANVVCPGSMDTAMLGESARIYDLSFPEEFAQHAYLRRLLDADEVAAAVAWLCSAESSAMTAAVIPVDGGFTG
jgi:SDR family mycofactocin-dependent oxidoreductase